MAEQLVNLKVIIDKLMRHPLFTDITYETVIDYTVDFMRIVGVPKFFTEKVETIEVTNYKGLLPCDWYETIQVRNVDTGIPFRYATDTYHLSETKNQPSDYTFMIQGNYIYTSLDEGSVEMAYKALPVDGEGIPLIPDNSVFYRALEAYVKKNWFTILFDLGKISPQSLQLAQQDYAWAVGACETEFQRLDLSRAESFFNSFSTLLIRGAEFENNFRNLGTKEHLRRH